MAEHTGHDHGHRYESGGDGGRRLFWALLLTLGFAAIEALGGFWSGSLALLVVVGGQLINNGVAWLLMHEGIAHVTLQPEANVYAVRWLPHGGHESRSG